MINRQAELIPSTQGCGGGLYILTEASARGECRDDDWVTCGCEKKLSW